MTRISMTAATRVVAAVAVVLAATLVVAVPVPDRRLDLRRSLRRQCPAGAV